MLKKSFVWGIIILLLMGTAILLSWTNHQYTKAISTADSSVLDARTRQKQSETLAQNELAGRLAAQAQFLQFQQLERSSNLKLLNETRGVLLAIQSMRIRPSFDAASVLHETHLAYPAQPVEKTGWVAEPNQLGFSPNGKYLTSIIGNSACVIEFATNKIVSCMLHNLGVMTMTVSPDNHYVASGSDDATLRVWELETGKEIARLQHTGMITQAAFSPDGKYLASLDGGRGGESIDPLRVWDLSTKKALFQINYSSFEPPQFSQDGKRLLVGSAMLDAMTGEEIFQVEGGNTQWSPDGRYIFSTACERHENQSCPLWAMIRFDASTGQEISRVSYDSPYGAIPAFSPDGEYIASYTRGESIRIRSITDGLEIMRMRGLEKEANLLDYVKLSFSPNGKYLIAVSGYTTRAWLVETGEEVALIDNVYWRHKSVIVSPDSRYLVAINEKNHPLLWNLNSREAIAPIQAKAGEQYMELSPNGQYASLQFNNYRYIRLVKTATREYINPLTQQGYGFETFSPDSRYVSSTTDNNTFHVWDILSGKETARFIRLEQGPVRFSPHNLYLAETHQRDVLVREIGTGNELLLVPFMHDGLKLFAFSPNDQHLLTVVCKQINPQDGYCQENKGEMWDIRSGQKIFEFQHELYIASIAFSLDGRYFASGGKDQTAQIWDAASGKMLTTIKHDGEKDYSISDVIFSPDSQLLATHQNGTISVWNIQTGQPISRVAALTSYASWIAFSPNGQHLMAYDRDEQTTHVWDSLTGQEVWRKKQEELIGLTFHENGKLIVALTSEGVHQWLYRPEDLIADACQRVPRNLTRAEWKEYLGDALPYQAVCPNLPLEP